MGSESEVACNSIEDLGDLMGGEEDLLTRGKRLSKGGEIYKRRGHQRRF